MKSLKVAVSVEKEAVVVAIEDLYGKKVEYGAFITRIQEEEIRDFLKDLLEDMVVKRLMMPDSHTEEGIKKLLTTNQIEEVELKIKGRFLI